MTIIIETDDEEVSALIDLSSQYATKITGTIPEWYAECILALYTPSRAPSLSQSRELIRSGEKDKILAILFLSSVLRTKQLDSLRRKGLPTFLAAMFVMWEEFNHNKILNVCKECRYFARCPIPRITDGLSSTDNEVIRRVLHFHNTEWVSSQQHTEAEIMARLVDPDECLLLKGGGASEQDTSDMLNSGSQTALEILETALSEETEASEEEEDKDLKDTNLDDIPRLNDTSFLASASIIARTSQLLKNDAGITSSFLREEGEESTKVSCKAITEIADKLREPHMMLLDDDQFYEEILSGEPLYGLDTIPQMKAAINLTIYVDMSTSMVDSQVSTTALATVCAFLDVFGTYGRVTVIPFAEEVIKELQQTSLFDKDAAKKWLATLCKDTGREKGSVTVGFGGTAIQAVLLTTAENVLFVDPACINYMVLITDAEDLSLARLPDYFSRLSYLGVSVNTILISEDHTPMSELLDTHTLMQRVSPEDFRSEAPKLLRRIALNYKGTR